MNLRLTLTVAGSLLLGSAAHAQLLYVTNLNNSTLDTVNLQTGVVSNLALTGASLSAPVGLAVDTSGNIYVGNSGNNSLLKFDSSGVAQTFNLSSALSNPQGLIFDSAGNLYVANAGANNVSRISPTGTVTLFASGNGLSSPNRLAFDASGNLFVTNFVGNTISEFNSSGAAVTTFAAPASPGSLTPNGTGSYYVSSVTANTISVFNPSGGGSLTAFVNSNLNNLNQPVSVITDSSGSLYVANLAGNSISKFSSSGTALPFTLSGVALNGPGVLAFAPSTAAPEAGSLALLVVALPLAGLAVVRRKQRG